MKDEQAVSMHKRIAMGANLNGTSLGSSTPQGKNGSRAGGLPSNLRSIPKDRKGGK